MRVAVTTSREGTGRSSAVLLQAGLQPVVLPCIEVAAASDSVLEEVRREAELADLLLVTSARTIRVLWPDGGMPATPVAAVGEATAAAVTRAGGVVDEVGASGASGLVRRVTDRVAGRRIVFPHGSGTDPGSLARLRSSGAEVRASVVYRTRSIPPASDPVEAALFGSPSAVEGWCLSRSLEGILVGAIGPTTAAALAGRGRADALIPERPGLEALAAAIAHALSERSAT